jgi:AraC-like DNA-binding protein
MPTTHTLSAASVNLILFAARQRSADPAALCRAAGIDPAPLRNPDARLPIGQVQRLWREVVAATGDPHLSLRLGELINPVSVGVLAYVMMHCPTLGRALAKLCEYQDIVCDGIRTVGQLQGDRYRLSLHLTCPDIIYPEYALNSELSMYQAAIRALTGRLFSADEIHFAYPRPLDASEHQRVFAPASLRFDAPETVMWFGTTWLDTPILNANPGLFDLFETHAEGLLRGLRQPTLKARVKTELVDLLKGEEPTLPTVADRLAMGVRTLQLHLKAEGVSYQQLLDEVRRELAVRHLREPHLSTTDIAYLLGFAEPSVFVRSFKRWTGQTPGAFRQQAA